MSKTRRSPKLRRIVNQAFIDGIGCIRFTCSDRMKYQGLYCSHMRSLQSGSLIGTPCHLWKITKLQRFLKGKQP